MHPERFLKIRDFSQNFGDKILYSGHVMRARDVILGGVVQFTMLVVLNKKILIFGAITKSPRSCYVYVSETFPS
jgi:hypothetical protein